MKFIKIITAVGLTAALALGTALAPAVASAANVHPNISAATTPDTIVYAFELNGKESGWNGTPNFTSVYRPRRFVISSSGNEGDLLAKHIRWTSTWGSYARGICTLIGQDGYQHTDLGHHVVLVFSNVITINSLSYYENLHIIRHGNSVQHRWQWTFGGGSYPEGGSGPGWWPTD